ncbi:MAG: tRNA (cytidine(34)-2'-O)-methyltransferase [Elusimicrobiota bacterium]
MKISLINIVLIDPEIPGNTGNVGRTCIGLDATLHLVGKIGFSLEDKYLKRAGLDYWPKIKLEVHSKWEDFLAQVPQGTQMHFFSTHGTVPFWDKKFAPPVFLIFGSEGHGFPKNFYETYKSDLVKIPVTENIRSLNLATAVGAAAFEAARQLKFH